MVARGLLAPYYNPANLAQPPVLSAPSAILIDADTGQILWGKNPEMRRFPASTTKVLTSLIFIEHTKPSDIVTCTDPDIVKIEPSSLSIKPWEKFTAQDLLYGTLLRSANDGAVVMAEHVAGTVEKFADLMNARAAQIGATNSHFVTPNGLHDPEHYTTVHDMALIAREAMHNPRFADAVSQPERRITRSILVHDSLIVTKAKSFWLTFPGADGIKTGYTHQAEHTFIGSASRDGRRLIAVAFGARNSAVKDAIPMLGWGFDRFLQHDIAVRGAAEPAVSIRGGLSPTVDTVVDGNLHASYDSLKADDANAVSTYVEADDAEAPIRKGQVVGHLIARLNGQPVASAPLIATENVGRSPFGALRDGGGKEGGTARSVLAAAGGLAFLLVAWRYYASTTAKSTRQRRSRVAAARRGANRGR